MTEVHDVAQEISRSNHPDHPIARHLQKQVANSIVLFINYKHYHWQVSGPLFRDLHLLFDEFASGVVKLFDEFAERLRMIGQYPMVTLDGIGQRATVEPSLIRENVREMIEEADRNAILLIRECRAAVKAAEEADDPGTADLFTDAVRLFEKQEWYFREILKTSDRLVQIPSQAA